MEEFPAVSSEDIEKALKELADEPTVLMFHAEMIPPITASVGDDVQVSLPPLQPTGPLNLYQTFLDSRPSSFETYAIDEIISLAPIAPKLPLHIVHLSAVEAIPAIRAAREKGIKLTAETCFHYLSLAAEEVKDGDTRHKCCPPIRTKSNQDGLWEELTRPVSEDPVIKTVVSDHSPCTPALKLLPVNVAGSVSEAEKTAAEDQGDFFAAWGGISSVGLGISILWTEGKRRDEDFSIEDIVRWCCKDTAKQVGLQDRKGDLQVGYDGDICVFDDEASFVVQPSTMLFRNKCSPYQDRTLKGVVKESWVRGRKVFDRVHGFSKSGPAGQLLLEPRKA